MRVVGCDIVDDDAFLTQISGLGIETMGLDEVVSTADVVSIHVPLLPSTRNLIDREVLARMKPGSILVNIARGGIVDEGALLDSLSSGHLGGAALDVHEREGHGVPPLAALDNVVLTPHIGAMAGESSGSSGAVSSSSSPRSNGTISTRSWSPGNSSCDHLTRTSHLKGEVMDRATRKRLALRAGLAAPSPIIAVGAHDALTAILIEERDFDAVWVSGLGVSATRLGIPDLNLMTMTEALDAAVRIDGVTSLPIVADCDNGHGGFLNVLRTAREYERAGIAWICIEDNAFPKRNSLLPGDVDRGLVPMEEQARRLAAAKEQQDTEEFVLIARVEFAHRRSRLGGRPGEGRGLHRCRCRRHRHPLA